MILPAVLILFAVAIAVLYSYLRRQPDRRGLWRAALWIGLGVGATRAALASLGWYVVEHTGGPHQIPGFALAMMAWPEATLLRGVGLRRLPPSSTCTFRLGSSLVL